MKARQERAAVTRTKLLAAAKASFAAVGYERTKIRDIVDIVGMSTGAFFAHWAGKGAAYEEVYGHPPVTPEQGRELLLALRGGPTPGWVRAIVVVPAAA